MQEGAVADHADPVFDVILALCLFHAVQGGDAGSHTNGGFDHRNGRNRAEGVATDVADHVELELFHYGKDAPVGTTGTKHGGTTGQTRHRRLVVLFTQNDLAEQVCAVLPLTGKDLFADHLDAHCPDLFLDHGFQLFKHVDRFHVGGKFPDDRFGQGVEQAELQHRRLGHRFLYVLVGNAARDETDLFVAVFDAIDGIGRHIRRHAIEPIFHEEVALFCHAGHHHVLVDALFIGFVGHFHAVF